MAPEGWAIVIGAFFSGLTGLLLATLPLVLQLRKNEAATKENAVSTKANTVALVEGGTNGHLQPPPLERVAAAVGALAVLDPVTAAEALDEVRDTLSPLITRAAGEPGEVRSIVTEGQEGGSRG